MAREVTSYKAYAKINWFLDITGKRADGYHELSTLMQKISLADEVTLSVAEPLSDRAKVFRFPSSELHLSIESPFPLEADRNNTIVRAFELFCEAGLAPSEVVHIHLAKAVPIQGGLGGGSSDAATVLRALNERSDSPLSEETLAGIARRVGADVPFCLQPAPLAYCTGIGDLCEAISQPAQLPLLLILPGLQVSTALAFARYDELPEEQTLLLPETDPQAFILTLRSDDRKGLLQLGQNTFTYLLQDLYPELGLLRERLVEMGASYAAMSGSGPTLFGLFETEQQRDEAKAALAQENKRITLVSCQTIGE